MKQQGLTKPSIFKSYFFRSYLNSTATTWALFALTQNLEAQDKLRNELLTVGTDNPTMDELNALPYLDAVVRETLRIHSPVASTVRVAIQDDILPLGEPVKDKYGRMMDGIP
jgi:cytochrome P450